MKVKFAILAVLIFGQNSMAKEWRGIVPLKSTRADVERLLGKPDKWGEYEYKDERVSFRYADGPCKGIYLALGKDNCKCLVDKDTVMAIEVEPTVKRKFSHLKLDMTRFTRTAIAPYPHTFAYYNPTEGIDYTVDESENEIRTIEYYPSQVDCQNVISRHAQIYRNSWRGLVPLHSHRRSVEALLGASARSWETTAAYDAENEIVTVKYSKGSCDAPSTEWNVPDDTVVEFVVTPRLSFLLRDLNLDLNSYQRQKLFPLPEIPNPPKVVNYINHRDGIAIRAQSEGGSEEVISITYRPATKDEQLRCHSNAKTAGKKS